MCMKSVNIVNAFYENDLSELGGLIHFGKMINEIQSVKDFEGNLMIEKLTIGTYVNVLSSDNDPELNKKYELLWQLGSIVDETFQAKNIGEAHLDTEINRTEQIKKVTCKSFTNRIFKFTLRNYKIFSPGTFYLKVYIREFGKDDTWQIQSMNKILVK